MQKILQCNPNLIIKKHELLNKIKKILKNEFVGIDQLIEDLTDSVGFWYLFPELQNKPLIINLWGMTGVGKTSLIKKMIQLLEMEKSFFLFELGLRSEFGCPIRSTLLDIYHNENGKPLILALDEFHNARTLDNQGEDNFGSSSRIIWQLLDSGKFQIQSVSNYHNHLFSLIKKLEHFLKAGVVVENGQVVGNTDYFLINSGNTKPMNSFSRNQKDSEDFYDVGIPFVEKNNYSLVLEVAPDEFISEKAVEEKLMQLNGYQTLSFLKSVYETGMSPKWVDCSKSLIFIMGNLDEAYHMTGNFSPDIEADNLHRQTLKIDVFQIKDALKKRFRSEQISRMGNIHFLFPAFSKKSFKTLIQMELESISQLIYSQFGMHMEFCDSVAEMIYCEGVFPAQGTRPVFSSIEQHIRSKLGRIVSEVAINDLLVENISVSCQNEALVIEYLQENETEHRMEIPLTLSLKKLKNSKKDEMQVISAVHESGHAVLSVVLLNTLPDLIISSTPASDRQGFMHSRLRWSFVAKKEIVKRLAMMLGGMAAEKLVFGDQNLTTGSGADLERATEFANVMIKGSGMGSRLGSFNSKSPMTFNYLYDKEDQLSEEAENLLQEAFQLAESNLKKQKILLLKMAEVLSIKRSVNKAACRELVLKYGLDYDTDLLVDESHSTYYRELLKAKIQHTFRRAEGETIDGEARQAVGV